MKEASVALKEEVTRKGFSSMDNVKPKLLVLRPQQNHKMAGTESNFTIESKVFDLSGKNANLYLFNSF